MGGDICCGGGVMSMLMVVCAVLARSWNIVSGSLLMNSVLCSRRTVRDGWRRPSSRLGIIALHIGMCCTRVGM